MTTLLRKDAVWMLPVALAGMVIGLMAMSSVTGGAGVWYRPDSDFGPGCLIFMWIAGGVLGLVSGLFEDVTFTREYLAHRPVSAARLFWTRQLGCALVLLAWIVVAPALHLGAVLLFHRNAPLVEPARYWSMLNFGSVGVAFHALGLFAALAARRVVLAVLLAFALSLALLLFFGMSLFGGTSTARVVLPLLAPIAFAVALPLMLAARRLAPEPRDVDQPGSRARLASTLAGLVLFGLAGSAFLHVLQVDLRRDILRRYPKMARLPDGKPLLLVRKDYEPAYQVDDRHRRIEGPADDAEAAFEPRISTPLRPKKRPFGLRSHWAMGGIWYERVMCGIPAYCLMGTDGRLHIYGYDREEGPAPVHHVGKADGAPFSADAQVVGNWGRVALVSEPAEGALWRFDLQRGGPGFQPAALPGGDTFVEDLTEVLEAAPTYLKMYAPHPTVIRGQKGLYEPERSKLRAASPEVVSAVESLDRRRQRPEAQLAMAGPVRFRATLPAAGNEPAFSHDYAPYTAAEQGLSVQMHGLSLLRPPLLELASLLFPRSPPNLGNPTDDDTRILLDPLVMLGARWVLVIDLLLGAALAALAFRRSTRLGLPAPRRLLWTAVAFGFGPAGFVVYRFCEADRAWQPLPEAAPKRALLIESAA